MYEVFENLCKEKGVTAYKVAKATGVSTATLSNWKAGRSTPKTDKLQILADYFDVPLETFTSKRKKKITAVFHKENNIRKTDLFAGPDAITDKLTQDILKAIEENKPTGYPVYYTDPETARIAQEVFDDPNLRMLFHAARDAKPEDIKLAADMLKRFKETNPDG
jgi:transcriptional regulator with XRE-family HTH domain